MKKVTGFISWGTNKGQYCPTKEMQKDSEEFVTRTGGVMVAASLIPEHKVDRYPDMDLPAEIKLSMQYGNAGNFRVNLKPGVARNIAAMLVRAADVVDGIVALGDELERYERSSNASAVDEKDGSLPVTFTEALAYVTKLTRG